MRKISPQEAARDARAAQQAAINLGLLRSPKPCDFRALSAERRRIAIEIASKTHKSPTLFEVETERLARVASKQQSADAVGSQLKLF